MAIALLQSGLWRGKGSVPRWAGAWPTLGARLLRVRRLALTALLTSALFATSVAKGQAIDEAEIEAHLRQMYLGHGERLLTWKRPIHYIVVGLEREQELKRTLDNHFAYVAALTGLSIQEADPTASKTNFILVFANPIPQIAPLKELKPLFGEAGQSDEGYLRMLESLERLQRTKFVTRTNDDSILLSAVLANPTSWDYELVGTRILQLIVAGLTKTELSNQISPSVWNSVDSLEPISRLPAIDEAYLRTLHRGTIKSGVPIKDGLRDLATAIASKLRNRAP